MSHFHEQNHNVQGSQEKVRLHVSCVAKMQECVDFENVDSVDCVESIVGVESDIFSSCFDRLLQSFS